MINLWDLQLLCAQCICHNSAVHAIGAADLMPSKLKIHTHIHPSTLLLVVQNTSASNDADASSIDIVNASAMPSRLGTPFSLSFTPRSGSPSGASGLQTPNLLHSSGMGSQVPAAHLNGSASSRQSLSRGLYNDADMKACIRQRLSRPDLAPFVRQAAPMVLSLEDPSQSTDEVIGIELQSRLDGLSLEELKRLNNML